MIAINDTLPDIELTVMQDGKPTPVNTGKFFADKRVILTAIPGAFTPTCSAKHLPSYIEQIEKLRSRGLTVVFVAVNDIFVLDAWRKSENAPDDIVFLADGNAELTSALGLELDATGFGMGMRSKRYALYAENGKVKGLWVEAPGEFRVSAAEAVLKALPN